MAIASGTVGTCSWEISNSGVLTIGAGNINLFVVTASSWPWYSYREQIVSVNFSGTVTFSAPLSSADKTCAYMFYYMRNLTSVTNLNRLNTAGVKNMFSMFYYCNSLTSINVSTLNTSSVTNMGMMFWNCSSLTSLDLSSWNTSNVTNMYGMFKDCSSLVSLDITGFNVSNVTDFGSFLSGCEALESIDVSGFATSSAIYMQYMFYDCSSLTSLDLSLFDTSNVTSIHWIFYGCGMLTSVTLGSSFDLDSVDSGHNIYFVLYGKTAENTTNGIIITSDQGFFSLTTAERQGVWDRACDAAFSATAARTSGGSADEDGEDVTFSISYVTESASQTRTLSIYQKAASTPSYPSTAVYTASLSGDSGTATPTISNIGDEAYDFKVVFYDGENYFTEYPSVQSNIRLFTLDTSGNVEVLGDITSGGDVTATDSNGDEHSLAVVGDFVSKNQSTNVSTTNNAYTNICSISLDAGTWIMFGNVRFANNATGRRGLSISSTSQGTNEAMFANSDAVDGSYTRINVSGVVIPTATTTYYLVGWQNSGAALNAIGYIRAVRIK